jgi:hypothetical protein
VSVNSAVSSASVNIGAPLCEAEDEWSVEPVYAEAA